MIYWKACETLVKLMNEFTPSQFPSGICRSDNTLCVKWSEANIWFTYSKRGEGLNCHFLSHPDSIRHVKKAINRFMQWAVIQYGNKCFFAMIEKPSVERLVKKLGFEFLTEIDNAKVYVKWA